MMERIVNVSTSPLTGGATASPVRMQMRGDAIKKMITAKMTATFRIVLYCIGHTVRNPTPIRAKISLDVCAERRANSC